MLHTPCPRLLFFVVGLFLSAGCSRSQARQLPHSNLPLVEAARHSVHYKSLQQLERLVAQGADVNAQDRWGRTALMEAASVNGTEAVGFLLSKGASVSLRDNGKTTALILAAAAGCTESARLLLEHGVEVN